MPRGFRFAWVLGAVVMGLAACAPLREAASAPPVAEIEGMLIRNELPYPVHDVLIEVPVTGGYAGCGMILQRSQCSTTFPIAAYRREALTIRWTEHGEPQLLRDIVLDAPNGSAPAWLEVTIFASGQAGARLVSAPGP